MMKDDERMILRDGGQVSASIDKRYADERYLSILREMVRDPW